MPRKIAALKIPSGPVRSGAWVVVPASMAFGRATASGCALFYPDGLAANGEPVGEPTWIATRYSNLDHAEDEAGQYHGKPLACGAWHEDLADLPAGVPTGFEDAWCAKIWDNDEGKD